MKEKTYQIDGTTYTQRPLVLGQLRQLRQVLTGFVVPSNLTPADIIASLEDKLPQALAILLTPEGAKIKDKDLDALASELENSLELETAIEVIEDFFTCNPVASLANKLAGMAEKMRGMIKTKTGSSSSSSNLPTETLPGETESSGDTPSTSASPT